MIDKDVFREYWKLLEARFNSEREQPVLAMYYDMLSEVMETGQFIQAARAVFYRNRFFPTPAELVAEIAQDIWPEVSAVIAKWSTLPTLRGDESTYRHMQGWNALTERARRAVQRAGGLGDLHHSTFDQQRRRFLAAYEGEALSVANSALAPPPMMKEIGHGSSS